MKNRKRNLTMLAVLMFVCAAVVLNWTYNNRWGKPDAEMVYAEDQAMLEADTDFADSLLASGTEYFAEARLTRQVSRDEAAADRGVLGGSVSGDDRQRDECHIRYGDVFDAGIADRKPPHRQGLCRLRRIHRQRLCHGCGPGSGGGTERRGCGEDNGRDMHFDRL